MAELRWLDVEDLRPAPYNPRKIDAASYARLRESVRRLGVIVPLIVGGDMTIVAGHQRSRAARDEGVGPVPCYVVDGVGPADEVRFNQQHNGTGYDAGAVASVDVSGLGTGWTSIPLANNDVHLKRAAAIITETCKLLERHGNVLSCVCAPDGDVLFGAAYLVAARLLGLDANAYVVPDGLAAYAKGALALQYGTFSYSHLPRETYVQGLAQRNRRDARPGHRSYVSRLYERMVRPTVREGWRVIDLGAGKGDYARRLGYDSWEPYHNDSRHIDVTAGRADYEQLISNLTQRGPYDAAILDSVLNSVDCPEAESAVVAMVNAVIRIDGLAFMSGRPLASIERKMGYGKLSAVKSWLEYLDDGNYTANMRNGNWYYQHYHTDRDVRELASSHGFEIESYVCDGNAWRSVWRKVSEDPHAEDGLRYEGSLPLPGGRRYDYGDRLVEAVREARHGS